MEIQNVGDLPDNPLSMPPPHWRSSGSVFHISSALEDLSNDLEVLVTLNSETSDQLNEYFDRKPDPPIDDPEFDDICEPLWSLEHKIKLKCETAILMSAIAAEDQLNMFAVYNFHKSIVEPLEKLSPSEKLQVFSSLIGHPEIKGDDLFASLKKLSSWRNAFAHGHCVDRPVKTLRHNHLISPEDLPGVPSLVGDCIEHVNCYVRLHSYLCSISKNSYTSGESWDVNNIAELLDAMGEYRFSGNNWVYEVEHEA